MITITAAAWILIRSMPDSDARVWFIGRCIDHALRTGMDYHLDVRNGRFVY